MENKMNILYNVVPKFNSCTISIARLVTNYSQIAPTTKLSQEFSYQGKALKFPTAF